MSSSPSNRIRIDADAAAAVGFLTVVGKGAAPTPGALVWFGPVGALVGALVGLTWWGAGNLWSPVLAAVLAVAIDLVLTGLLHLDGLADSADGLLPHLDRPRRLEAMAEPTVGAFAVATVAVVLLLRVGGVLALPEGWRAVAFAAGAWAAARTVMAFAILSLGPARPGGLATAFTPPASGTGHGFGATLRAAAPIIIGSALAVAGVVIGRGLVGLAALAGGLLASGATLGLARRRLGGYTGDVLGACGVLCETATLLVAAARW